MGGSDNKGDGLASQPRRYRVPGQPLLNRHQVGGVSRSPGGLFAQHEREPIGGSTAVRGKRTYGGRLGQRVEEQGTWASRTQKHSEVGYGRPVDRGAWTAKTVKRPRQQPAHPQYPNYWAPLTCNRHIMPHSAQPQHTNYWAPRTRKRHQQEHRPQRPTESSDPTQHAKGRTGDCPGPRKETTTRRNVTQGGVGDGKASGLQSGGELPATCVYTGRQAGQPERLRPRIHEGSVPRTKVRWEMNMRRCMCGLPHLWSWTEGETPGLLVRNSSSAVSHVPLRKAGGALLGISAPTSCSLQYQRGHHRPRPHAGRCSGCLWADALGRVVHPERAAGVAVVWHGGHGAVHQPGVVAALGCGPAPQRPWIHQHADRGCEQLHGTGIHPFPAAGVPTPLSVAGGHQGLCCGSLALLSCNAAAGLFVPGSFPPLLP